MDGIGTFKMSPEEYALHTEEITRINAELFRDSPAGRAPKQALGKDDFLQLLMKQLAHQDPLAPMEDREFISQMAQFSSLEQITTMSQGFTKLSQDFTRITNLLSGSEAASALGKQVEIADGEKTVKGVVREVTRGGDPQVMVNGAYYNWGQVLSVFDE